jgi:hypothetical protein
MVIEVRRMFNWGRGWTELGWRCPDLCADFMSVFQFVSSSLLGM